MDRERGAPRIDKQELVTWLAGPDISHPSLAEIAASLAVPIQAIGDTTLQRIPGELRALRVVLAVLTDVYADDTHVRRWLRAPRVCLRGLRPLDLILAGRSDIVEDLAVHAWYDRGSDQAEVPADESFDSTEPLVALGG
jgi:hypothetical protein